MYVVRLPLQTVEETVTYGWTQGTSPYLVVTLYSMHPPCLNFAVHTGYMLPRRLCRLDALLGVPSLVQPGTGTGIFELSFCSM